MTSLSSGAIQDSVWYTADFMVGAGMVIIQPSSGKVVLLYEIVKDQHGRHMYSHWFLPKGRKDVGESLEQTALREAYEEVRSSRPRLSSVTAFAIFARAHNGHVFA